MSRSTLLEMCVFALTALPEERLAKVLPALAALAGPHSEVSRRNIELDKCIHDCIKRHQGAIDQPSETQHA